MGFLDQLLGRKPARRGRPRGENAAVQERNTKIREDFAAGMEPNEICAKFDIKSHTYYAVVAGLPRPPRPPRPLSPRAERWLAMYENGTTASAIAEAEGLSRERVCQVLRPHRVIEKRAERQRIVREAMTEEAEAMRAAAKQKYACILAAGVELVRNGMSIAKAAKQVGLMKGWRTNTLQDACRAAGVVSRHGRWSNRYEPKVARARELRGQGLIWSEISESLKAEGFAGGISKSMIMRCKDITAPLSKKRSSLIWTDERTRALLGMWYSGASVVDIAAALGSPIKPTSIYRKLSDLRAEWAQQGIVHDRLTTKE